MLNKAEVIETINREVVPVQWNSTTQGFPDLPAMKRWAEQFRKNPWARMIFAHHVLMDPDGSRLYGSLSCQCLELIKFKMPYLNAHRDLKQHIRNFKDYRAVEAMVAKDPERSGVLEAVLHGIEEEIDLARVCDTDIRFQTSRFLQGYGATNWMDVLKSIKKPAPGVPDPLEPAARPAFIRALGDFVLDDTPFDIKAEIHLRLMYANISVEERGKLMTAVKAKVATQGRTENQITPADIPVPPSLRRKAATALSFIFDLGWADDDKELIAKARAWWADHRDEKEFKIPPLSTAYHGG